MGHLVRQAHIANILQNRGGKVTFFLPDYPPAQAWLNKHGFSGKTLSDPIAVSEKETALLDLILLDIQDTTEEFIKRIRLNKVPVVSFEDRGEGSNHVDLLIDCNRNPEEAVALAVQNLFGYPYCVLAPEFEMFHAKKREFQKHIQSVLITLGGTDPHSLTATLADKLLQKQPDLSITLLAGPGCKNIPALKNLQSNKVKLTESTSQMAQTLFEHDAVFCAGGVTLDEAMAVGTPAFVINQVPHQLVKSNRAEKQGAAINLGMAESWDENRLEEILKSSPESLREMSQCGKNLIDGKGLNRVVDAIDKALLIR